MLKVVEYPNPVLLAPCDDVTTFDGELKRLIDDMAETMYASKGVGIAAPQVGLSRKIIIIDPSGGESSDQLQALINPVITWASPEVGLEEEGCLSLPGVRLQIPRHLAVEVEYNELDGQRVKARCTEWAARIVQHELEHLSGVLMVDKVGSLARKLALKKLMRNG